MNGFVIKNLWPPAKSFCIPWCHLVSERHMHSLSLPLVYSGVCVYVYVFAAPTVQSRLTTLPINTVGLARLNRLTFNHSSHGYVHGKLIFIKLTPLSLQGVYAASFLRELVMRTLFCPSQWRTVTQQQKLCLENSCIVKFQLQSKNEWLNVFEVKLVWWQQKLWTPP